MDNMKQAVFHTFYVFTNAKNRHYIRNESIYDPHNIYYFYFDLIER